MVQRTSQLANWAVAGPAEHARQCDREPRLARRHILRQVLYAVELRPGWRRPVVLWTNQSGPLSGCRTCKLQDIKQQVMTIATNLNTAYVDCSYLDVAALAAQAPHVRPE